MLRRTCKDSRSKRLASAVFAIALALAGAIASPAQSYADETSAIGYTYGDSGEKVYYEYSQITDMMNAGYSGKVVYLNSDLGYNGTLYIQDGKSITIDLCGYKLRDSNKVDKYQAARVTLGEGSNLTLKGSVTKDFAYADYSIGPEEYVPKIISSGGAVMGKAIKNLNCSKAGCVEMGDHSTLTLDHVALLGGCVKSGGGVKMGEGTVLNMTNGSTISGCYAANGGGIKVNGTGAKINMSGNSTIEGNGASSGAGIWIKYSEFEINSSDSTAKIAKNNAYDWGGGICVAQKGGTNWGHINNVTITENSASNNGGGVSLIQEWTTLKNCTISNNKAGVYGGGIYDDNDYNMVKDCTIQNNTAGSEGGGVFVYYKHDLRTGGVLTVDGNKRTDGADDDVFLDSSSSNDTWAYLYGDVDMGSHIGVRTGVTKDRRIVTNKSKYEEGTFFLNIPQDYWLTYRKDDKELWQSVKTSEIKYLVTVNGEGTERYDTGETVTVDAGKNDSYMTGNMFSHWDASSTTGFSPVEKFINEDTAYNSKLTFTMPNNDVHLKAVYCDPVVLLNVYVDEPVAGKALATEALVNMTTENGSALRRIIGADEFKWYKKTSSGDLVEASGVAEYGCTYVFKATLAPNAANGLVYKGNAVTQKTGSHLYTVSGGASGSEDKAASRGMNSSTGVFELGSDGFTVAKAEVSSVESASITVKSGITKQALIDALPKTAIATINDGKKVELSADTASATLPDGLIEDGVVAAPVDVDSKVWTVTVPVNGSDSVKKPDDDKAFTVKVTVVQDDAEIVPAPTVSPINGTYDRYNGDVRLNADGSLKVTAALGEGSKSGTKIYYQIDDGNATEYSENTGIVLKGTSNDQAIYFVSVWAQRNNIKSDEVQCFFMLDDTLQKSFSIGCRDTALDDTWSASFVVTGDLYTTVNVAAPEKEGHVFDHWEWTGSGDAPGGLDLTESTLTLADYDPSAYEGNITAVYTPVLDSLRISMGYPEAGKKLDQTTTKVSGTYKGTDRTLVDLMSYFADGGSVDIKWSPNDTTAKGNTAYTATLALKSGVEKKINGRTVKYAIADDVEVDVSDGNDTYLDLDSSYKKDELAISFPATEVSLHTVSFNTGEDGPSVASQTVEDGACAKEPETPEMSGFKFEGWAYEDGRAYDFKSKVTDDLELHAQWAASGEPAVKTVYTVTFNSAGGSAVATQEVVEGTVAKEPSAPTLKGFDFAGWFDIDGEPWDFDEAVTRNITLYAHWAKSEGTDPAYLVVFESAGGTAVDPQTVASGGTVSKPQNPTREGCKFQGWFCEDGSEFDFATKVTSDLTLYAQWSEGGEPISAHTVTFDSAGGSEVASKVVADGACVRRPDNPTLAGFDFDGWYTEDGDEYDFANVVTADITLYAHWKTSFDPESVYLVIFDSAGGSAVGARTVKSGDKVEKPADPTLKGCTFVGWFTKDSTEAYDFDSEVTENLTLYAHWEKSGSDAVSYTVTFDSAGGTPVETKTVAEGECVKEPTAPTRAGYDFCGWTLDGKPYDFKTKVKSNLELKATWKKQESKKDDSDGGDSKKDDVKPDTDEDKDGSGKDDGDKGGAGTSDEQKGSETKTKTVTTVTTTTASSDSRLAATGDRTLLIVGALVALGILAAAAGIVAKRKKK